MPFCRAGQIRLFFFASDQHKGLAKCLLVKLLDLGTKTSRAGVGKGLCRLCQQIYLSLVRVKSCGTETKLLWFLGSPKSKDWVGSYKLPHKLLPLASQSCSVCHLPFSGPYPRNQGERKEEKIIRGIKSSSQEVWRDHLMSRTRKNFMH